MLKKDKCGTANRLIFISLYAEKQISKNQYSNNACFREEKKGFINYMVAQVLQILGIVLSSWAIFPGIFLWNEAWALGQTNLFLNFFIQISRLIEKCPTVPHFKLCPLICFSLPLLR